MKIDVDVRHVNLYRVLLGNERPAIGWLDPPLGTFDNVPLLENMKLEKGAGINLTDQQWKNIVDLNPDGDGPEETQQKKIAWLESSDNATNMVMEYNSATGIHRIHTPEVSGNSLVNVLNVVGNFAIVECWDVSNPFPENWPFPLVFKWRALTLSGASYEPRGGIRFPTVYWRSWAYLPFKWMKKL